MLLNPVHATYQINGDISKFYIFRIAQKMFFVSFCFLNCGISLLIASANLRMLNISRTLKNTKHFSHSKIFPFNLFQVDSSKYQPSHVLGIKNFHVQKIQKKSASLQIMSNRNSKWRCLRNVNTT